MPTYRRPNSTNSVRFTLVELVVVMAIMTISFGLVAFSFAGTPEDRPLDREAARLAGWVRSATAEAAESGRDWIAVFDMDTATYEARPVEAPREAIGHTVRSPVRMESVARVADTLEVQRHGRMEVAIAGSGACEPHMVRLVLPRVGARTIEVNPVTGEATVLAGRHEYRLIPMRGSEAGDEEERLHVD